MPETTRRTAVVTGTSSGIGAAYAERLASLGHDVVLVARRVDRLEHLAERLRAEHRVDTEPLVADLAERTDVARVAERLAAGDVGLLVNNAGINGYGPFAEVDAELLTRVIAINVTAVTVLARAAVPAMLDRGGGAIVNVASVLAYSAGVPPDPMPRRAVYAATKSFVVTFSRTLAVELAGSPVRVQALCPGLTATEFHLTAGDRPVVDPAPHARDGVGMPAADVVTASLAGLAAGETVCIPGLAATAALDELAAAETAIMPAGMAELAARYRAPGT